MITLRDIFAVTWDITELWITAREPESMQFIHQWAYGDGIRETTHMYYDRMDGKLTMVNNRINHHGEATRGGAEMGWGVNEKLFPPAILDAPVTHMLMRDRSQGRGTTCSVDVEMHRLTAETIITKETDDEN